MGREAAQEYERTESIDADPMLAARVRRIGNRLIAVCDATQYPFEFHEVETNEINAFAMPGGFVYFFRGLAQLMPGDDALAFIMAHEISHVTQRHGVKQMEKSMAIGAVLNYTLTPGMGTGLLHLVIDMHYSRHDEAEADRLGLALMAKAGFDPTQGAEAMQVIARIAKSSHSMPALLRSHPLPETRIAALRREAATLRPAPHPAPPVAAAPSLPAPSESPTPPAPATVSDLFPLTVGMSWTYLVTEPTGTDPAHHPPMVTTSVIEQPPGRPGLFRLRTELDGGIAWTRLVTVTSTGVFALKDQGREAKDERATAEHALRLSSDAARSTPAAAWKPELGLPANDAAGDWESVRVPAGEYRALRATQHSPGGETATVWLAPGVGIVRRSWERTGLVEELEALHRPAPEQDRGAASKALQNGPAPSSPPVKSIPDRNP
jgi:hypothetical protein